MTAKRPRRDERLLLAIALCAALAGCNEEYRKADDEVLCNPSTGQAFMVHEGAGATSFVQRNKALDALCNTTQGQSNAK